MYIHADDRIDNSGLGPTRTREEMGLRPLTAFGITLMLVAVHAASSYLILGSLCVFISPTLKPAFCISTGLSYISLDFCNALAKRVHRNVHVYIAFETTGRR